MSERGRQDATNERGSDRATAQRKRRLPRLFTTAASYAVPCWLIAMPWYLRDAGLELVPFLLTLTAGALCAASFTGWAQSPGSRRTKLTVHVLTAAAVAGALALLTEVVGWGSLRSLPSGWIRGTALFLSFAALPFALWTVLHLIGRLLSPRRRTGQQSGRTGEQN